MLYNQWFNYFVAKGAEAAVSAKSTYEEVPEELREMLETALEDLWNSLF